MSVQWPLEQALASVLTADAAYTAAVTGGTHGGSAPEGTALPYVVVGERTERDRSTHSSDGAETTVAFHIWSGYRGDREVLTIYGHLRRLLHYRPVSIAGHDYRGGSLELVTTNPDPDGETMHGVARYRIRTRAE